MEVDPSPSPPSSRPPPLPGYFDPESSGRREEYRRYSGLLHQIIMLLSFAICRKRLSSSNVSPLLGSSLSKTSEARLLYDGDSIPRRPNAGLLLEDIKQEAEDYSNFEGLDGSRIFSSAKRRGSLDGGSASDAAYSSGRQAVRQALKQVKLEDDMYVPHEGETSFTMFASLLDSVIQGLMPIQDVILQFEKACRSASESIRSAASGKLRVVEDKFMQQKAQLLLDEAASWSLLWYLYGKGNDELPGDLCMYSPKIFYALFCKQSPTTSHQEACRFVAADLTAQLCLRIVLWLEGLASEALDLEKKVIGSHVGSYLPSSGVWHCTQRYLKRKNNDSTIVKHVDFDAPTREGAQLLPDDKKQDELLLEDIWTLLRAGRLEEASELCRSAGQAWRAATLCPFGGIDMFPSLDALLKNGKSRTLQAIELESGIGRQWRLWKWASYCASESACWAMARSWLDVQVDLELSQYQTSRPDEKQLDDDMNGAQSSVGPESWPYHVLDQQPRDITALLQKLHSSDLVHETVSRACREQHRQIEMNLMSGNIAHLIDLLWSWLSPAEEDQNVARPLDDPEMIRFGAHVVLVLRYIFSDEMEDELEEKLVTVGDLIVNMYVRYLFSEDQEELVGVYASQLQRDLCINLFVEMMEVRLNSSSQFLIFSSGNSLHTMYKLFLSAVEYLPFSSGDPSKACFEEIIERVLSKSRQTKPSKYDEDFSDVAHQHHLQSLQKAMVIQWLCFTPPPSIPDFQMITGKLLIRALMHSNTLFREFSLISMRRVPELPAGPHKLLAILAEPLKQKENLFSLEDQEVSDNLQEFEDWVDIQVSPRDPCCIEVALRCLAAEGDGYGLHEANDGGLLAAIMAAGFKGELSRFQPGVSMAISRLDAWYSDGNGSVESTGAYIIRGLCRRCCLPETILRSMQACISLSAAGVSLDDCDKLVELVGLHFVVSIKLPFNVCQEFLIFERECLISKMELEEEQQLASDD
nr:unnamed protein product [Digitaria exilis]